MHEECNEPCKELEKFKGQYDFDKMANSYALKNIHRMIKQMKLADEKMHLALVSHMNGEDLHHMKVREHIAATNVHLKNSPTKEDLAKTNGTIKTMWILGGLLFLGFTAILGLLLGAFKTDLENAIVKASKANYYGTKKVIERLEK